MTAPARKQIAIKPPAQILVTGAAGFLGAWLAKALADQGYTVIGVDDMSGGFRDSIRLWQGREGRGKFYQANILDQFALDRIFKKHPIEAIFHLAAYAAEGMSPFIRRFNYENNVVGSMAILNEALKRDTVRLFAFTSSIAVYGDQKPPFREETSLRPIDPYGVAKAAVEHDLRAAAATHGINFAIFRPHNIFGPFQNLADPFRNVIGIFLNCAMRSDDLTVFGNGRQTRAFSYVEDVADAMARVLYHPRCWNKTFNIGGDEVASVLQIAKWIIQSLDTRSSIRFLPARHEAAHAFSSHQKAKRMLGYSTRTGIRDGLAKTVAWARELGPQRPRINLTPEVTRGMPPNWAKLLRRHKL